MMIAPTITMPWIAFVPDISGVCNKVGTFEITSKPRKIASTRIVSSVISCALIPAPVPAKPAPPLFVRLRRAYGSCCDLLLARHARARSDLVRPVELELAVLDQVLQQRDDVPRVQLRRVVRHRCRKVRQTDDRHVVLEGDLTGRRQLAVPARLR